MNRFEQGSFSPDWVHSPGLSEALGPHQKHRERIHSELKEFLSAQEARETATHVYKLALEIDEEIGRILKDPLVRRLYQYDGQFFTPRGTRGFFRGKEKHIAIRWLLDELGKHAWVAKRRRMNWEESHTLDLVPKEVLEAIVQRASEHREFEAVPPSLSPEEQAFFQSFEEQMERRG